MLPRSADIIRNYAAMLVGGRTHRHKHLGSADTMSVFRTVTSGINCIIACLQVFVNRNTAARTYNKAGLTRQLHVRTHADGNDNQLCRDYTFICLHSANLTVFYGKGTCSFLQINIKQRIFRITQQQRCHILIKQLRQQSVLLFQNAGMQTAAHKSFCQLQTDKACADDNYILNAAFGNFLIYCCNIPREPEAVNACGISIRQGKLHRRTAGCQHQHVIRQLFQLSLFHIMHAFLLSVYFLHITAAAGIHALHGRKIITVAQGSLRCMVKAVHALNLTADKIREAACAIAQLRSAFQHDNLCFGIQPAQARRRFHTGGHPTDDYYTFTHNVTSKNEFNVVLLL